MCSNAALVCILLELLPFPNFFYIEFFNLPCNLSRTFSNYNYFSSFLVSCSESCFNWTNSSIGFFFFFETLSWSFNFLFSHLNKIYQILEVLYGLLHFFELIWDYFFNLGICCHKITLFYFLFGRIYFIWQLGVILFYLFFVLSFGVD